MTGTRNIMRLIRSVTAMLVLLFALGCSTASKQDICLEPPLHQAEDILNDSVEYPVEVYDPLEAFNRRVYTFNYYFDKFLYLPVVYTYEFITPDYVEDRVSNFVENVFEFNNFTNNLLQLKFKRAGMTLIRFFLNTTIGIAGLWDPATNLGLPRQNEDFGQTLGHYGMGNGPYLVLPILGPSNLRDTGGLVADGAAIYYTGPYAWVDDDDVSLIYNGVASIDTRHRQSFRYYQTGSPFEYDMIRMLYTTWREMEIAK